MKNMHKILMRISLFLSVFMMLLFTFSACQKSKQHKNSSEIVVYKISRKTFFSFLENPSIKVLNSEGTNKCIYSKSGQWHLTSNAKRFQIEQSLLDFVGDELEIKSYLSQYGVNDEIKNAFVLDAPNVPLTIWVETSKANMFITIEKHNANNSYVYEYYTLSNYNNKYGWTYASLVVNSKEIQNNMPVKIYSDYADVPFVLVLKSLGATITSLTNEQTEISFKEKRYVLKTGDLNFYEVGKETINLLHKDGGLIFLYPYENDLMIDSFTLNTVLREMGEPIIITCDKTSKIVTLQAE